MLPSSLRGIHLFILTLVLAIAAAEVSTKVVAVTSTKTVHVTATNYAGACDNFVGACVVYGTANAAPYTTTVYVGRSASPPTTSITTSTTTIIATTTAANSGACSGFVGACVVYASNAAGSASKTVYYGASASARPGNAQGYIGPKYAGGGDGQIGGAAPLRSLRWEALLCLGGAVTVFAMLI